MDIEASCWNGMHQLVGQDLSTLRYRKPFTILSVLASSLEIKLGSGNLLRVARSDIDEILRVLSRRGELRLDEIEGPGPYVVAIPGRLPEVAYDIDPIRLRRASTG